MIVFVVPEATCFFITTTAYL